MELRKFNKTLEDLETIADKWLYFLRNATGLKEKPPNFQIIPELNKALEIANLAGLNREELEDIQNRSMWLADQEGRLIFAQETAKEIGREEGRQEGKQEGRQEGLIEGKIQLILTLLTQKLGEIPSSIKQKIEALSLDKLEVITTSIFNINNWEDLNNLL